MKPENSAKEGEWKKIPEEGVGETAPEKNAKKENSKSDRMNPDELTREAAKDIQRQIEELKKKIRDI